MKMKSVVVTAIAAIVLAGEFALAQLGPPPPPPPDPNEAPRERAPVDFTGTWVAPVMEDWRWRMVTPLKGDASNLPPRAPARHSAAGAPCAGPPG